MARARQKVAIQAPTIDEIAKLNHRFTSQAGWVSGVPGNFHNRNSLEFILEAIAQKRPIFGRFLYPNLVDKVAAVGWTIMSAHAFKDGNKRTGMAVCELFFAVNGWSMSLQDEPDVIHVAELTASNQIRMPEFTAWVESRSKPEGYLF